MTLKQFKLIGLTGQSGAGKTTVAAVLAECGFSVINADALVRQLYEGESPCLKTLAAAFGADILNPDGSLNRPLLAKRAFASKENTALLGRLVHPFVTAELLLRLRGKSGVVIYDAPQLFESGADAMCDCVVSVLAERDVRLARITARDGITEAAAQSRLDAQYGEEFFRAHSDIIIENNGDAAALTAAAQALANQLRGVG